MAYLLQKRTRSIPCKDGRHFCFHGVPPFLIRHCYRYNASWGGGAATYFSVAGCQCIALVSVAPVNRNTRQLVGCDCPKRGCQVLSTILSVPSPVSPKSTSWPSGNFNRHCCCETPSMMRTSGCKWKCASAWPKVPLTVSHSSREPGAMRQVRLCRFFPGRR